MTLKEIQKNFRYLFSSKKRKKTDILTQKTKFLIYIANNFWFYDLFLTYNSIK